MRYFNVKIGKPDINGLVVRINPRASTANRLVEVIDGDVGFEFLGVRDGAETYRMVVHNVEFPRGVGNDALGGRCGVPVRVHRGDDVFTVSVLQDGELKMCGRQKKKVYVSETNARRAASMREDAKNWALQRAYIYE